MSIESKANHLLPVSVPVAAPTLEYYPDNHLISGEVVFSQDTWDFGRGATNSAWDFKVYIKGETDYETLLIRQHKALVASYIQGPNLPTLKTSAYSFFITTRALTAHALSKGVTLFSILTNEELLKEACSSMGTSARAQVKQAINSLWDKRGDFDIHVPKSKLRGSIDSLPDAPEYLQTPVIPSRIYQELLVHFLVRLDHFERYADSIVNCYVTHMRSLADGSERDSGDGKYLKWKRERAEKLVRCKTSLADMGWPLEEQPDDFNIFISAVISEIQAVCIYLVAAFSGMRKGEILNLNQGVSWRKITKFGQDSFEICGLTTKTKLGQTTWVTIEPAIRAVQLAEKFALSIDKEVSNLCMKRPGYGKFQDVESERPVKVFCSTTSARVVKTDSSLNIAQKSVLRTSPLKISGRDMAELEYFSPDRDWANEGIDVGQEWPLALHQFRRSLAVYATASGLVSTPSLKGQFQHLTREMSRYYKRGAGAAIDILAPDDHFSVEYLATQAESQAALMALSVLQIKEAALLGAGAKYLHSEKVSTSPVSLHDREHTIQLIRKGVFAYKETVLGGCTSPEACKMNPLSNIQLECIKSNCKYLVIHEKRLDRAIAIQRQVVERLEPLGISAELAIEKEYLEILVAGKSTLPRIEL